PRPSWASSSSRSSRRNPSRVVEADEIAPRRRLGEAAEIAELFTAVGEHVVRVAADADEREAVAEARARGHSVAAERTERDPPLRRGLADARDGARERGLVAPEARRRAER